MLDFYVTILLIILILIFIVGGMLLIAVLIPILCECVLEAREAIVNLKEGFKE